LSEISFRTDPENIDYVLKAGATRSFEALSKAENQAKLDENAHREEIELNPILLLEERTKVSKGEMERMEDLEELHELNKRNMDNELHNKMLSHYQKLKEQEDTEVEKQDEEFVKLVYRKNSNNQKIDRTVGEPFSVKQLRTERTKVILSQVTMDKDKKNSREKSIGRLNSKRTLNEMAVKRTRDMIPGGQLRVKEIKEMDNGCSTSTLGLTSNLPSSSTTCTFGLGSLGLLDYNDSDEITR
jgi:hypothetical protein